MSLTLRSGAWAGRQSLCGAGVDPHEAAAVLLLVLFGLAAAPAALPQPAVHPVRIPEIGAVVDLVLRGLT